MEYTSQKTSPAFFAGAAKEDITPTLPLRLAGFGDRQGNYAAVREPLYVRCLYLKQNAVQAMLLSADLLWWGRALVERVQQEAALRFGLPPHNILLSATHNHSGPPTDNHVLEQLETYSPEYTDFLLHQTLKAMEQALHHAQPASLSRWTGQCALNVNLRLMVKGKIEMMPNYQAPRDTALTLLRLQGMEGQIIAQMHHYACHATVSAENSLQPEYPGIANRLLDEMFPGSVSLFWQGATADLRPNIVLGDQFIKLGYQESQDFAKRYIAHLLTALESPGEMLDNELLVKTETIDLPLECGCAEEDLQRMTQSTDILQSSWAKKVLKDNAPTVQQCHLTLVRLGHDCPMFFVNAELVQSFARFARALHPSCLTICYTNGMIGYLCGEEEIRQGGYEPLDSSLWFALRGPYNLNTHFLLEGAMERLLQGEK